MVRGWEKSIVSVEETYVIESGFSIERNKATPLFLVVQFTSIFAGLIFSGNESTLYISAFAWSMTNLYDVRLEFVDVYVESFPVDEVV